MGKPKPISASVYTSNKLAKYLEKNEKVFWKKFDIEDYASGVIRFEQNKSITFQMSYLLNCKENEKNIKFFGTKGGLSWPNVELTTIKNNITKNKSASILELQHFIDSITKKRKQKPDLKEMETMTKIIETFHKSIYKNKEIII